MVTAGVYLVVRSHVLFEISDVALDVVAVVGLAGALYGGFASLGQYDMKRALAYSTMSQLGFMFLAAGLGCYPVAISLLVAHAFYKALLFLTSGNVMHGLHDEIDVRRLGGLRRDMPWTAALFAAGALALSGLPPFSGFFTKDAILELASHDGEVWAYVLGSLAALLSAWYIARLFFRRSSGTPRYEGHAHEASPLMRAPLVVLAVGASVRRRLAGVHPRGAPGDVPRAGARSRRGGPRRSVDAGADRDLGRADPRRHRDRLAPVPPERTPNAGSRSPSASPAWPGRSAMPSTSTISTPGPWATSDCAAPRAWPGSTAP